MVKGEMKGKGQGEGKEVERTGKERNSDINSLLVNLRKVTEFSQVQVPHL